MKKILITSLMLFNLQAFAEGLIFKLNGKPLEIVSLNKIKSGNLKFGRGEIKSKKIKLYNVFRGYERTYVGYNFNELLNLIYGKEWQQKEKLTFTSTDGYHQIALIPPMIKSTKNKIGYIAFTEEGKIGFSPVIKDGKMIDPGPLYLVWTNFTLKDKASHGDIIKWPYQLSDIDLE
ncbi:MAG: hypothetical protein H7281_02385 [Bacteriovorax sp.]|nr:hypothetical protein [Bacteriovorax sp.]